MTGMRKSYKIQTSRHVTNFFKFCLYNLFRGGPTETCPIFIIKIKLQYKAVSSAAFSRAV
jgi:hypothetical protein